MRVLIFGDSITQGFWDSEGGWVNRLRRHYDLFAITGNFSVPSIMNLGISGNKVADVVDRLEVESLARITDEGICYVFAIGLNDTRTEKGIGVSTPEKFLSELNEIYNIASKFTSKIAFVGLSPADDAHSNPLEWDGEGYDTMCYNNERIKMFDDILKTFCRSNNILYISVFDEFLLAMTTPERTIELLPDALHPSDMGHELIYDIVKSHLEDFLG